MTNESPFKAADLLRAFQWIFDNGKAVDGIDGRTFGPLSASMGFDGYTITLENAHAAVTVNFHNTLVFSTKDKAALKSLQQDLAAIKDELSSC